MGLVRQTFTSSQEDVRDGEVEIRCLDPHLCVERRQERPEERRSASGSPSRSARTTASTSGSSTISSPRPGLYGNAWLEPLNSLAFAAALTKKVKIATGILVLPVRHPVVLAKEISTLCHLSENRYMFGVGPGWYAREYEVTGSRIEERGRRTDEIIEAVTLLLTRPNASYQGKYYQFNDVTIEPRPPKMPAIWVSGDRACRTRPTTTCP